MIFLVYAAQLLSILFIIFHYNQHFQCKKKSHSHARSPRSPTAASSNPRLKGNLSIQDLKHHSHSAAFVRSFKSPQRCCLRCFESVDGEQFDLFPISFLFYLVFILMISTLILIKQFFFDYYDGDHSMYHLLHYSENPLITAFNGEIAWKTTQIRTERYKNSDIMDWVICYCIMMLSIVESWFNFHRYYITKFTSKHFFNPETRAVVRTFGVYAVLYVVLFIFHIHFMYWLFPLIICLHGGFNIFCTWRFCAILIERYQFYSDVEEGLKCIHQELLCTVYVIRRASVLSAMLSALYISLFCVSYDVNIVLYIPILWSASNFSFLFNFVRNRVWIQRKLYFITHCIKPKEVKPTSSTNNVNTRKMSEIKVMQPKTDGFTQKCTNSKILVTPSAEKEDVMEIDIHSTTHTNTNPDTVSSNASNITPFAVKTPRFLPIPTPTAHEAEDNEIDSEYQQWYMNRKKNATIATPTSPNAQESSSFRISISDKAKTRKTNSARNLKLFDVLGIDKTPLSQENDDHEISLAYDMDPISTELTDTAHVNRGKAQTPIVGMFVGIISKASSLARRQSDDLENIKQTCLISRARSSSDPTSPTAVRINSQSPKYTPDDNDDEAPKHRLMLHISQTSNQSEPTMEHDANRLKHVELNNISSHSMMNLSPMSGSDADLIENPKLIVSKERNVHAQSIPNDILLSVLVQHGFCSRSSFNAAKQLSSYLQDK